MLYINKLFISYDMDGQKRIQSCDFLIRSYELILLIPLSMLSNLDFKYNIHGMFVMRREDIKNVYNFNSRVHIDDSINYFQTIMF